MSHHTNAETHRAREKITAHVRKSPLVRKYQKCDEIATRVMKSRSCDDISGSRSPEEEDRHRLYQNSENEHNDAYLDESESTFWHEIK